MEIQNEGRALNSELLRMIVSESSFTIINYWSIAILLIFGSPNSLALQDSLVFDLILVTLNHSCLVQPGCKLPCQELVPAEPIKAKYFILKDSIDEAAESREGSNA